MDDADESATSASAEGEESDSFRKEVVSVLVPTRIFSRIPCEVSRRKEFARAFVLTCTSNGVPGALHDVAGLWLRVKR